MKRTLITLTLMLWVFLAGFSQITDPFFEKVTYVGAFGKTDWTKNWANFNPQTTVYPATTVTIGDGTATATGSAPAANVISTDTRWSSSNSPLIGNASFTNANLTNSFFEQVNYIGAFGTYDWTQGWANWDPQNTVYPATTVTVPAGHITTNTTWTSGNVYKLDGWVYVDNGVTLTIQAGTVIRGDATNKGALIIERGGKLIANGTASQPIVFTSNKAPGSRSYGDWGGVIICGYAQINQPGGTAIIEGGVGSVYGGGTTPNNADNSGSLTYVRIEFPGIAFAANNEINGLTMGGVGTGTTLDYIQVSYSGDDSFEWFGGAVNAKHLIALRGWDDDFDTDNGFTGKIQFGVILRDPAIADVSGSNGFESDNDATGSTNTPITKPIFSNISVFGPKVTPSTTVNSNYKRAMHLRRNTMCSVYNSVFCGWPEGLHIDGNSTQANATANNLQIENTYLAGMVTNFTVPSGQTWTATDEQNWFMSPSRHNNTYTNNTDMILVDPFNLTAPNFLPTKNVYKLNGWIFVRNNATLTIDPGTIIRGDKTAKGALIIEQTGKLVANGTETEPIIFTSNEAAGSRAYGDWGGVILCGQSIINQAGGTATIEGGVGSTYGGSNTADNSGSLKYVRIEFPGIAFAANNEINGLTMGGVGSGTSVDYVQVSYSGDDSYEWFGGTVNAKHLIAFRGWDDEFDTDNGFSGKVQFAVSLRDPAIADVSSSNGFESDNDATGSANTPKTEATFSNVSLFGPQPTVGATCNSLYKRSQHLRRNTGLKVHNSIFLGWPEGLMVDGNSTQANAVANILQEENNFLAGMVTNFTVPAGQTWSATDAQTWFMDPTRHNNTYVNASDLQIIDGFNLSNPNFLPQAASPVWGASRWSRTISGVVSYDNVASTPMTNTSVVLKTQGGTVLETTTTNASGAFTLFAIDGNYVLEPTTSKATFNPNLGDVIDVRRKIANLITFNALQNKASDVNQTNSVNLQDPIVMRQRIAGITPLPSWKIANYVFETPTVTISGSNVVQNIKALAGGDARKDGTPPLAD